MKTTAVFELDTIADMVRAAAECTRHGITVVFRLRELELIEPSVELPKAASATKPPPPSFAKVSHLNGHKKSPTNIL